MEEKKVNRIAIIAFLLLIGFVVVKHHFSIEARNPEATLEFHISSQELPELHKLLEQFAANEGLILDDNGADLPPYNGRRVFDIWLERNNFLEVSVSNMMTENRILVSFYKPDSGSDFNDIVLKLKQILQGKWPDIAFTKASADS